MIWIIIYTSTKSYIIAKFKIGQNLLRVFKLINPWSYDGTYNKGTLKAIINLLKDKVKEFWLFTS